MLDFSSKKQKVSRMTAGALHEARGLVAALIGPLPPGHKLKTSFPRVARLVGMTERRVRAIWSGENRKIDGDELDALRLAVVEISGTQVLNDTRSYAARLDAAAFALEAISPSLHRQQIDRLRNVARGVRNAIDQVGD